MRLASPMSDHPRPVDLTLAAEVSAQILDVPVRSFHELLRLAELRSGWVRVAEWQKLGDIETLQILLGPVSHPGELWVISDLSYGKGSGAFTVPAARMNEFADTHLERFGKSLFNGDVIVISREQETLWFFHHEGMALRWSAARDETA